MTPRRHYLLLAVLAIGQRAPAQDRLEALNTLADALIEAEVPSQNAPDQIVRQLLSAALTTRSRASSSLAIEATMRFVPQLAQPKDLLQLVQNYLASSPHPLGEISAQRLAHRCQQRLGILSEKALRQSLAGYASSMIAVGPFGDGGDFYTGVNFAPEISFPDTGKILAGRFGPVSSYVVRRDPWLSFISLRSKGATEVGCFYGLHQVRCDRALSAYLEITCAGSFELFVNEHRLAVVDRRAESFAKRVYVPVQLRQGNNRVLIKTTRNRMQLLALRYVDARGATLQDCRELEVSEPLPLSTSSDAPSLLPTFVDGSGALRAQADSHLQAETIRIAAMFAAFANGDENDGLELLIELNATPPADPRLRLALARGYDLARDLPLEIRNSRARALLESAEPFMGDHSYAVLRRSKFLAGEDQPETAIRLLTSELDAGRGSQRIYAALVSLCARLGFEAEHQQFLQGWLLAYPKDARPALRVAELRDAQGDRRGASELLTEFLSRVPGEQTVQSRLFGIALATGQLDLAQRMMDTLKQERPETLADLRRRVELAEARQQSALGNDLWRQIAAHPEAGAKATRMAGDQLLRAGQEQAAIEALQRSIAKNPSQPDLRRLLSRLHGKAEDYPMIARYRYAGDAIITEFAAGEREQGAPSSLLLDQMIVRFYPDGERVEETHQIRHINDLRGVEAYEQAYQAAAAAEIITLRTIGKDGSTYLPTRVAGSYAMPRLEPGAFIEEEYRNYVGAPGAAPLRGPTFFFQGADAPFLLTELVIILPPGSRGSFRIRNFAGETLSEDLPEGYRAHIYRMRNVPRLHPEPLTPDSQDTSPVIAFGEDRGSGERPRARHAGLRRQIRTNPVLAKQAQELIAGLADRQQQVQTLYDFVQDSIQAAPSSSSPTATLLHGQGQRFELFAALIKAAGIPMQLALASQAHESLMGLPTPLFFGEERYPLPAARILPDSDQPIWAYASSPRYAVLGTVSAVMLGAPVLLLSPGRQELSRLPAGDRRIGIGLQFSGELVLNPEGTAQFSAQALVRGNTGLELAEQIRMLPADRRQLAAQSLASQFFPGWTLQDAKINGLEPGSGLGLDVSMTRRSALNRAGMDLLLGLPMPPSALFAALGGPGDRSLPMQLTGMTHNTWTVEIDPGDAFRIVEIPEPLLVRHEFLDYQLSYTMHAGKLRIRRSVTRWPGRIPVSGYPEWVELLHRLDLAEAAQIKLRKEP